MFFAQDILCRRNGPLGVIWLFGTCSGDSSRAAPRISKREILGLNLPKACQTVQYPEQPFALRLSSQLLTGLARVFNKQVCFLWDDVRHIWVLMQRFSEKEQKTNEFMLEVSQARYDVVTHADRDNDYSWNMMQLDILQIVKAQDTAVDLCGMSAIFNDELTSSVSSGGQRGRKQKRLDNDLILQDEDIGNADVSLSLAANDQSENMLLDDSSITLPDHSSTDLNMSIMDADGLIGDIPFDFTVDEQVGNGGQIAEQEKPQEVPASPPLSQSLGLPDMDAPAHSTPKQQKLQRRSSAQPLKRGPLIDANTMIDSEQFRQSLASTTDIVLKKPKIAPAKIGGVTKEIMASTYTRPAEKSIYHPELLALYHDCCVPITGEDLAVQRKLRQALEADEPGIPRGVRESSADRGDLNLPINEDALDRLGDLPDGDVGLNVDLDLISEIERPRAGSVGSRDTSINPNMQISMPWTASSSTSTNSQSVKRRSGDLSVLDTPLQKKLRSSRRWSIMSANQLQTIEDTSIGQLTDLDLQQFDVPLGTEIEDDNEIRMHEETRHFYDYVARHKKPNGAVMFSKIVSASSAALVGARALFQVLVLASTGYAKVEQQKPYGEISIFLA